MAQSPSSPGDTFTVPVEVNAWVHSLVDGPMGGAKEFAEPASPSDTVGDVLFRLSQRFPKLHEALWEGPPEHRVLGGHLEIMVNNTILGTDYHLDSPVSPNTQIMITGQFVGG